MINFRHRPGSGRPLLLTGTALVGLVLLAGCGSSTSSAQGGGGQSGQATQGGGQQGQGYRRQPGVSGKIAEIDGKTLQVQGTSEQTAVTWTAKTTFTSEVKTDAAAVRTGACVLVRSATGASASAATTPATTVAARSVNIVSTGSTSCTGFGGFGAGGRRGTGAPSGMPSGMPSGGSVPGGGAGGQAGERPVSGKVTAVSGSSFTVEVTQRSGTGASSGTSTPATTTRTVTVTTSGSTTYTTRKKVGSSAAKVGLCADAQGRTDSTGALTATTIAISSATDGSCSNGFGGGFGGTRG